MHNPAVAAACELTGASPVNTRTDSSNPAGRLGKCRTDDAKNGLRENGGRRLSDQADAGGVVAEPTSPAAYGVLRRTAAAQIRRECRKWSFDWDAFVAGEPEWAVADALCRREEWRERERGVGASPSRIPVDVVLSVVREMIQDWTEHRELRPTAEGLSELQARRGAVGLETQQRLALERELRVMALVAVGLCDAAVADKMGVNRSTVGRIRRKVAARTAALQEAGHAPVEPVGFPAPEVPVGERWPVVQFTVQTGVRAES